VSYLSRELRPHFVTFLTDVAGVYDRPPNLTGAKLLVDLTLDKDGNVTNLYDTSVAKHDVTGGMKAKVASAIDVALLGIDCYITQAGTEDSINACKGLKPTLGTYIHKI